MNLKYKIGDEVIIIQAKDNHHKYVGKTFIIQGIDNDKDCPYILSKKSESTKVT